MKNNKQSKSEKKPKIDTFPKAILVAVIAHAILCITASYVLAFINHTTVENLSITIVGQIVAPLISYLVANVFQNIFEKNKLSFSTPISLIENVPVQETSIDDINIIDLNDEKET